MNLPNDNDDDHDDSDKWVSVEEEYDDDDNDVDDGETGRTGRTGIDDDDNESKVTTESTTDPEATASSAATASVSATTTTTTSSSSSSSSSSSVDPKAKTTTTITKLSSSSSLKDSINIRNFADEEDGNAKTAGSVEGGGTKDHRPSSSSSLSSSLVGFQTMVDGTVSSIRNGLEEHVTPKVQSLMDGTHQNLQNVTESIRTHHEQHVVPQLSNIQTNLESWTTNTQRSLENLGSNTKQMVDTHVTPQLVAVQQTSLRTIDHVGSTTQQFHTQHIQPLTDKVVSQSQRALQTTNQSLKKTYRYTSTFLYRHRGYYWNSAPALMTTTTTGNSDDEPTTSTTTTWYHLLEESTVRSFGQVVYCQNPITGIFVWMAILVACPLAGVCSLISVVTVNGTALYFDFVNYDILRQGLYGCNAVLIGTSIVDYFEFNSNMNPFHSTMILIVLCIVLGPTTLLVKLYLQCKVFDNPSSTPVLLLPFNFVMIVVLISARLWDDTIMVSQVVLNDEGILLVNDDDGSETTTLSPEPPITTRYFAYQALFNGISRIFLIDGVMSGLLILIGVFLCSRILCASLVAGSFMGSIIGLSVFGDHVAFLNAGYSGFNPALAVAGIFYFMIPSWKLTGVAFFWIFITMILTTAVNVLLDELSIPVAMSFGFCFAVIPLLSLDMPSIFPSSGRAAFMRRIPVLELSTPEEYLMLVGSIGSGDDDEENDDDAAVDEESCQCCGTNSGVGGGDGKASDCTNSEIVSKTETTTGGDAAAGNDAAAVATESTPLLSDP